MIFRHAKIRLALSIAGVQLLLFAAFGLGIYAYVTVAFDFDPAEGDGSIVTAEASFATLRTGLAIAYAALVLVIPVTSYLLASLAMRPIRASFEAQQRFVDDASHEFRTPLSALQAQLELGLSRQRSIREYRTILGHSLHASRQLNEVVDDLLILSRGARYSAVAMREVDVSTIIADAIEQLPPGDSARVRRTDNSTDLVVTVASSMLTRALVNLIVNALRYSEPDSFVTVGATRRGKTVRLWVEDRGVGMSRTERTLAFDRFWRADASRSSEGRGLGLSIVREIASLHGGRVDLASELGVGTIAAIEIPLSR